MSIINYSVTIISILCIIFLLTKNKSCKEMYTDLLIPPIPDPSSSSAFVSKFKDIFSVYWNQYLPSDYRAKCFACEKEEEQMIRG